MKKIIVCIFIIAAVAVAFAIVVSANSRCEKNAETVTCPVSEAITENGSDLPLTVEGLKAKYGIDSTYKETVDKDFNGCTSYYYGKVDKNGVENPYDALKITVDNETGEISYKRFDNPKYIEAKINRESAEEKATEELSESGKVSKCVLEYYMPEYPKGDIFLAYRTEFKNGEVIYIDAVSGNPVGRDRMK